ncbi:MAG: threonine/serine exporter family protein [Chloroflexota bacterium]
MLTLSDLLLQGLLGLCVTIGFGILFNVPRDSLAYGGVIGAVGHVLRFALRKAGLSNEVATFFGALAVGLLGYWVSHRLQSKPRMIFTVTGIISMVPGIPAYEMIIYFSHSDTLNGIQSAVRAVLATGAIAAGLSTARLLTEFEHRE